MLTVDTRIIPCFQQQKAYVATKNAHLVSNGHLQACGGRELRCNDAGNHNMPELRVASASSQISFISDRANQSHNT